MGIPAPRPIMGGYFTPRFALVIVGLIVLFALILRGSAETVNVNWQDAKDRIRDDATWAKDKARDVAQNAHDIAREAAGDARDRLPLRQDTHQRQEHRAYGDENPQAFNQGRGNAVQDDTQHRGDDTRHRRNNQHADDATYRGKGWDQLPRGAHAGVTHGDPTHQATDTAFHNAERERSTAQQNDGQHTGNLNTWSAEEASRGSGLRRDEQRQPDLAESVRNYQAARARDPDLGGHNAAKHVETAFDKMQKAGAAQLEANARQNAREAAQSGAQSAADTARQTSDQTAHGTATHNNRHETRNAAQNAQQYEAEAREADRRHAEEHAHKLAQEQERMTAEDREWAQKRARESARYGAMHARETAEAAERMTREAAAGEWAHTTTENGIRPAREQVVRDATRDVKDGNERNAAYVRSKTHQMGENARQTAEDAAHRTRDTAKNSAEDVRGAARNAAQNARDTMRDMADTAARNAQWAKETTRDAADNAKEAAWNAADRARQRAAEDAHGDRERAQEARDQL